MDYGDFTYFIMYKEWAVKNKGESVGSIDYWDEWLRNQLFEENTNIF